MMTSFLLRRAAAHASATSPRSTHVTLTLPFIVALGSSCHRWQVCTIATMNHNIMEMESSTRHRYHAAAVAANRYPRMEYLSASNIELVGQRHYPCHHQRQRHIHYQQKQTHINLHNRRQLTSYAHFSSSTAGSNNTSGSGDATNPSSTTTTTTIPVSPTTDSKKVTTLSIIAKKRRNQKITMVTAYDYPSAVHVDRAGMDIVLVGDSCAMVELGFETTLPITLDQMIHHCQAVKRGAPNRPLLVGDMPFGSYEFDNVDIALQNAYRMVKDGGMDAVKFEGGTEARSKIVRHVVQGGIAVLGHVGLTPQAINVLGGFRAQGRKAEQARSLLDEALRLQDAGAFAVVLECIPSNVATAITEQLEIPTIGIGAGGGTSGQVLVFHDLLGMLSHPHHEEFCPKFCKKYASVGIHINDGLAQFKKEVEEGVFPGKEYSPYTMCAEEEAIFNDLISKDKAKVGLTSETPDESDQLNLYGSKH